MSLLREEPGVDEAASDRGDVMTIEVHAAKFPDFPLPFAGGVVRVACPEKEEYVSSAAFSDDSTLANVWARPYGIGLAAELLTLRPNTMPGHKSITINIVGRWWPNGGILTGYKYGGRWETSESGNKLVRTFTTDWAEMGKKYDDISKIVLRYLDEANYHFRRPKPKTFRQMIYAHQTPETDDFRWLTVNDVWALREQCKRMKTGTWTRMRRWLMRQRLADTVRRALGGRPGRLLKNQRRARDSRAYRRVRTDRKKGGLDANRPSE